jgi:signal transduction histidine kinase
MLLGYAQLLEAQRRRHSAPGGCEGRALGEIIRQANRLDQLITRLLDTSHIQLGQFDVVQEDLDLNDLATTIVEAVRRGLTRHTLVYDGPAEPLIVAGDRVRLEEVLHNLIDNAIKYTLMVARSPCVLDGGRA